MEFFGLFAFVLTIGLIGLPDEVKKLKREISNIKRREGYLKKEVLAMAKMLVDLKGRDCMIKFEELPMGIASNRVKCNIIDVDEEWIKFTVTNKKGEKVTKITRLEKISEVEIDG